jgi:hypothetical protein
MSARRLIRIVPALVVVAILCISATTPTPGTVPPNYFPAPCVDYSEVSGGANSASFTLGDGTVQPLSPMNTMSACSLRVEGTGWSYPIAFVREWDPVTLAPDPSTIALRTMALNPSLMNYYYSNTVPWMQFSPPIVAASVANVADVPRTTLSMQVNSDSPGFLNYPLLGFYEPEGDAESPVAQMVAAGGAHQPLSGSHPVLAHAVCPGSEDVQSLKVGQAVIRTDTPLLAHPPEVLQSFRVPEPIELRWVELAINRITTASPANGELMPVGSSAGIEILAAVPGGDPPIVLPPRLVSGIFEGPGNFYLTYSPTPRWASHSGFDQLVMLYPGRDYWLHMTSASSYEFLSHTLTGGESPAFTAGVGPLWTRLAGNDPWTTSAGKALAFKIIGRPTAPVGVAPPLPEGQPFRLAVAPNPARGPLRVEWSGAVGPVRLEVLDARGRRVATGSGGAAGTWSWGVAGSRPLASGVYFVRAHDSENRHATQRFVVLQ